MWEQRFQVEIHNKQNLPQTIHPDEQPLHLNSRLGLQTPETLQLGKWCRLAPLWKIGVCSCISSISFIFKTLPLGGSQKACHVGIAFSSKFYPRMDKDMLRWNGPGSQKVCCGLRERSMSPVSSSPLPSIGSQLVRSVFPPVNIHLVRRNDFLAF